MYSWQANIPHTSIASPSDCRWAHRSTHMKTAPAASGWELSLSPEKEVWGAEGGYVQGGFLQHLCADSVSPVVTPRSLLSLFWHLEMHVSEARALCPLLVQTVRCSHRAGGTSPLPTAGPSLLSPLDLCCHSHTAAPLCPWS